MEVESLHVERVAGVEVAIAIHSTRRGPALGGCRWKPYESFDAARGDALALAAAMTRKAALAELDLGGGKTVVRGDPASRTREQLLAVGAFVDSLEGRYIVAADMGTGEEEMAVFAERTRHVSGLPQRLGGCGSPAPFTAIGVLLAIEAALAARKRVVEGARVAIQGLGSVGSVLARLLLDAGARVIAADPDRSALEGLHERLRIVEPDEITCVECDVFSPCGPPGVVDSDMARAARCEIVCGAANNPLSDPEIANELESRGILYVPDFLASAGGVIHLAVALAGGDAAASRERLRVIPRNLERTLVLSREECVNTAVAAERLASRTLGAALDDLG